MGANPKLWKWSFSMENVHSNPRKAGLQLGHAFCQIFFTTYARLVCDWLPQGRSKFDPLPGHGIWQRLMLFPILEVAAVEKGSLGFPLTFVNRSQSLFFCSGRGMNAAFAVGRLCDFEAGCKRMLSLKTSDIMVIKLRPIMCLCHLLFNCPKTKPKEAT